MAIPVRPQGHSVLRVARVCLGEGLPYGTRVEDTAWGTLVGVATGSESGWDCGARDLGTPALSLMFAGLRGPDPVAALPDAFAAVSEWFATDRDLVSADPDLPMLTVVVALCEPRRITLAWVGHEKAYLLRAGRIAAESEEHTRRMFFRGPLARPLAPKEAEPPAHEIEWRALPLEERLRGHHRRFIANLSTLSLTRDERGPPAVMQLERRPGDTLLLISGILHQWMGFDAGLGAALATGTLTIDRIIAQFEHHDPQRTGEVVGRSDPYGPILLAEL